MSFLAPTLIRSLLFLLFIVSNLVFADPWTNLQQGDQTAAELLKQAEGKTKETGPNPFFASSAPEAGLSEEEVNSRALGVMAHDPSAQMIQESSSSRPRVKLDPTSDPLLNGAQKVLEAPLIAIGGEGTVLTETTQAGSDETLTCEESGEEAEYTCKSYLLVDIKEELGPPQNGSFEVTSYQLYGGHGYFPLLPGSAYNAEILKRYISGRIGIPSERIEVSPPLYSRQVTETTRIKHGSMTTTYSMYRLPYSYRSLIKVPLFSWDNRCGALEAKVDEGNCFYVSKVCTKGPETRVIGGISVPAECWEYTYTYSCSSPSQDDCGPLRGRGCVQVNSGCKTKVNDTCTVYTQTYQCKAPSRKLSSITGGQAPFCLDGNCRDQGYELNDELFQSLAQLNIVKELQGQLWNGMIFTGDDNRCSKQPLSFKDCCGSGKGWGTSLNLTSCSSEEKNLGLKRQKKLCHYVGTYCAKKVLGQCVKKKSTFCCFKNKLFKILHEQGRPQIGLGWGDPKAPLCRGFTIEELQRIDFSRIDFSEAFEDLLKSYQPNKLQNVNQTLKDRLETIQKSMSSSSKGQKINPSQQRREQ